MLLNYNLNTLRFLRIKVLVVDPLTPNVIKSIQLTQRRRLLGETPQTTDLFILGFEYICVRLYLTSSLKHVRYLNALQTITSIEQALNLYSSQIRILLFGELPLIVEVRYHWKTHELLFIMAIP